MQEAVNVSLPGGPRAASRAREELGQLGALDGVLLERLRVVVTELVTNSVRHADPGAVQLGVLAAPDTIRVEVSDEGPGFTPTQRHESDDREGGRGLLLVERLASRWGVLSAGGQTRVWCELDR